LWWFPLPEGRSLIAADVREQHDDTETPSLEDVQRLISHRVPKGIVARDPRWLSWFHIQYRVRPHYRHGRTFLAGDAAHIHSPISGQGMNTGIQDAYNLAWKLALVTGGAAPEKLLDSYEAERRAVAQDVLATTRNLTEKAVAYLTVAPEERERLYRYLVLPDADRLKMLRHTEELDLDYRQSPICSDRIVETSQGKPLPGSLHAGAEARDVQPLIVRGARLTLFELLRGTHHSLLILAGDEGESSNAGGIAEQVAERHGNRVRVFLVSPHDVKKETRAGGTATFVYDVEGALHRRYEAAKGRIFLIRPDGYIGFRGRLGDLEALRAHLARVFSRSA